MPKDVAELQSWIAEHQSKLPINAGDLMKTASMLKFLKNEALPSINRSTPYQALFKDVVSGNLKPEQFRRIIRQVAERGLTPPTQGMRDALSRMTLSPIQKQGLLNDIVDRDKLAPSTIMNKIFGQ